MDDDVAQRPGKAHLLGAGGEGVVRVGVLGDEYKILVLRIRDQSQLLMTHLLGEFGEVFSGESLREILKAHLFPPEWFEIDHNRLESDLLLNDSIESLCMSHRVDRLAAGLGDAMARMQSLLRKDMAQKGVSLAQARTLNTLEREGPRPLSELAALEQVSQPAMSNLVARMELKGHVRRSSDAADGRVVIVSITGAGSSALNGLLQHRADILAERLSDLSASDVAALENALPALGRLIVELGDRRTVGTTR